ncbi:MAG: hypothetical protein ACI4MP_08600 [Candidatus Ventricola sp.]
MKKKLWYALMALCLLLPAAALGVTDGVVEDAPMVAVDGMRLAQEAAESYLPDETVYAGYGGWTVAWENAAEWVGSEADEDGCYEDVEQRPRLTAGEAARAKALLARVQAGEIAYAGESILDRMEDVIVGVYALDPGDYDGERAYVLLPGTCLTDEQLLSLIDAFDRLGLVFDPDALNYRNCARGGGIECSRFLAAEERERFTLLANLIERGLLDAEAFSCAQAVQPKLDSRYYCGMEDFTLRPYRAIPDEELCAMLVQSGVHDRTGEVDVSDLEKTSRAILYERLGCPLSMTLAYMFYEGGYTPAQFDANGNQAWASEGRSSYGAFFTYRTAEGIEAYADTTFDRETGELVSASTMHSRSGEMDWDAAKTPFSHEALVAAIAEAEKQLGLTGLSWHLRDEECYTNWGSCWVICAQAADDLWVTAYIGMDDGQVHGLMMERGTLVETLPQEAPVNR